MYNLGVERTRNIQSDRNDTQAHFHTYSNFIFCSRSHANMYARTHARTLAYPLFIVFYPDLPLQALSYSVRAFPFFQLYILVRWLASSLFRKHKTYMYTTHVRVCVCISLSLSLSLLHLVCITILFFAYAVCSRYHFLNCLWGAKA